MIRLRTIELRDFKNTKYGKVSLEDLASGCSIMGLYGQNGSGKTSIVEALACVKRLVSGEALEQDALGYISAESESFGIDLQFGISANSFAADVADGSPSGVVGDMLAIGCRVYYSVEIGKSARGDRPVVCSETLALSTDAYAKRNLVKYTVSFEERADGKVGSYAGVPLVLKPGRGNVEKLPRFECEPAGKWKSVGAFDPESRNAIAAAERIAYENGESFVFGDAFANALSSAWSKLARSGEKLSKAARDSFASMVAPLIVAYPPLVTHIVQDMFVSTTIRSGIISLNKLWIDELARKEGDYSRSQRFLLLATDEPFSIKSDVLAELEATVSALNVSLSSLVPGLSLVLHRLGAVVDDEGEDAVRVELLSDRNGVRVPFHLESEGIQKLVSILSMLVTAYNDENACVVIDELDSGVFEFLLGEILEAMANGGKGQLIFTAHNLRALEMLPTKAILFTTTNPGNRYIRFRRKKPSNNLRNQYLRTINLGGQQESVYEPTDSLTIRSAFYDAGHPYEDVEFDDFLDYLEDDDG